MPINSAPSRVAAASVSFTDATVSRKLVLVDSPPSETVNVIVAVPFWLAAGVTTTGAAAATGAGAGAGAGSGVSGQALGRRRQGIERARIQGCLRRNRGRFDDLQ